MNKSTLPVETGIPNPFFSRALEFLRSSEEMRNIVADIQSVARLHSRNRPGASAVDIAAVLRQCSDNGVKDKLRAVFDRTKNEPKTSAVLGPAPSPKTIYGRFGTGVSIVDVGSGNGQKLRHYTGSLKITCVDPLLDIDPKHVLAGAFKLTFSLYAKLPDFPSDPICSSFMSLCQMPPEEQEHVLSHDGLHVVPDHDQMVGNKVAVVSENGTYKVRTFKCDYEDFPVPLGGFELQPGYRLLPVYRHRDIVVDSLEEEEEGRPVYIDCSPASFLDMNFQDAGYKFDGVPYELEALPNGLAYLTGRNGKTRIGRHTAGMYFAIHVEDMGSYFVLLRVAVWRGYVPPHDGYSLRAFADCIKLVIDSKPLYGPPVWNPGIQCILKSKHFPPIEEAFVDGLISRLQEHDFYCKEKWTVDFYPDEVRRFENEARSRGYTVADANTNDGLCEYVINKRDGDLNLTWLKKRPDKNKSTKMDTAVRLLDQLDLGESAALTGSPAMLF